MNRKVIQAMAWFLILAMLTPFGFAVHDAHVDSRCNQCAQAARMDAANHLQPTDDTWIRMLSPTNNYGDKENMNVRNRYGAAVHEDHWEHDALIRFDMPDIRPGRVYSATLWLYYFAYADSSPAGRTLTLHRVEESWNEDEVTWQTAPAYDDAVTATAEVPDSPRAWMHWDVTADVVGYLKGRYSNHGWQLMDEEPFNYYNIPNIKFYTKEHGAYAPYLEIKELKPTFLAGEFTNRSTDGDMVKVEATNLFCMQLFPLRAARYIQGETLYIQPRGMGILTENTALGIFNAYLAS